jgi:predicted transcriptional regulator YheO
MSVKNLKTANDHIFDHYTRVGEIISEKFSPYLEVIIHDLRDPEHSIIAIFNSHITGRKIGDGTSDIGYKKLANELPDKIVNYENISPSGSKMKSSSLTIRDEHNKIIGSMAFNFDLAPFENIQEFFNTITKTNISQLGDFPKQEQFFIWNIRDELEQELNKYIIANRLQGKALTKKDKLNVVSLMNKRGHIKKRGSVSILSELLAITRPTLYKYIKDIDLG